MAGVTAEPFAIIEAHQTAALTGPAFHGEDVIVNAVLATEPFALAGMTGEHAALGLEGGLHVGYEVGLQRLAEAIHTGDGIDEVEVRNGRQGLRRSRGVIGGGRSEGTIANQDAGGFMVAVIIDRRSGENQVGARPAEQFGDAPSGFVGVEDGHVAELGAAIFGSNDSG